MTSSAGLQIADYLAVVGYLLVTMLIVYWSSRKQSDTEDFFLGGRSMPWFAVGLSIMATLLSTNTYLGAPGEMIKYGPAYVIGFLAYPLLAIVVVGLWIPFFMRLRLTSAYEYLERRFDYRARMLGNVLFLGLRLGWMSMVVYTASMAMVRMVPGPLQSLADWVGAPAPIFPVIVAVGAVAILYAFFGGMRAVIWTDVLQAVMLFGGVLLIIVYVMFEHGTGIRDWWHEIVARSEHPPQVKFASWDVTERTTILWAIMSIFFWNVCTHCSDQVALQRYFTTTSIKAARRSFIVNIVCAASIGMLLAIAGLALRYHYQLRPDTLPPGLTPESGADQIMPHFYATALPAGFGGLILVSFLCDAMQTLVSGVNSITAIITTDVASRRQASQSENMRLARGVTIGVGLVSTLLAIIAASIVQRTGDTIFNMLPKMFNLFLGPLASMFMVGMFFSRARGRTVFRSVLITLIFSFCWSWWTEIGAFCQWLGLASAGADWKQPSVLLAVAVPAIVGVILGGLFSMLESNDDHPGRQFTWRQTMNRSPLAEQA